MARKQGKNQKLLIVSAHHIATANVEERLCRAIDILLQASSRDKAPTEGASTKKEEPPHQASAENGLTGGYR